MIRILQLLLVGKPSKFGLGLAFHGIQWFGFSSRRIGIEAPRRGHQGGGNGQPNQRGSNEASRQRVDATILIGRVGLGEPNEKDARDGHAKAAFNIINGIPNVANGKMQ